MRAQMEFSGETYTHAHLLNENMYAHFCLSHFFQLQCIFQQFLF